MKHTSVQSGCDTPSRTLRCGFRPARFPIGIAAAFATLATVMPALGQFQLFPAIPPEPATAGDYRWPSRFIGCDERIALVIKYKVDSATPNWESADYKRRFTGWGVDLRQSPGQVLTLEPFVASAPWRPVARTRDGDGLAGIAWPSPVEAIVPEGLYDPLPVLLGVAFMRSPALPSQQTTDVIVTLESTVGDVTEGVMMVGGKLVPIYLPESTVKTLIRVVNIRRCPADIAGAGQSPGPDGEYTADDIIVFFNLFFAGHPLADIASPGQGQVPDGDFTADDIIVYLNWFFSGCQPQLPCSAERLIAPPAAPKSRRAGPSSAAPVPPAPSLDPATIAAMQQLINTLPPGPQRDQLQAQLDARLSTGGGQAAPGQPAQSPSSAPASGNR